MVKWFILNNLSIVTIMITGLNGWQTLGSFNPLTSPGEGPLPSRGPDSSHLRLKRDYPINILKGKKMVGGYILGLARFYLLTNMDTNDKLQIVDPNFATICKWFYLRSGN